MRGLSSVACNSLTGRARQLSPEFKSSLGARRNTAKTSMVLLDGNNGRLADEVQLSTAAGANLCAGSFEPASHSAREPKGPRRLIVSPGAAPRIIPTSAMVYRCSASRNTQPPRFMTVLTLTSAFASKIRFLSSYDPSALKAVRGNTTPMRPPRSTASCQNLQANAL